jgi:hypothetical protein
MPTKLDPKVKAMLPSIYTREQLEYAKGVVDGSIKVRYFKASDIPEKKPTPEAFKKQHKAKTKVKAKAKQKRLKRIPSEFSHDDMLPAIRGRIMVGHTRQDVIQILVETFRVSKHSAGYHYDKFVGKR